MQEFNVFYKNEQVGKVEFSNEGLFTVLKSNCTYFPQVMRLYAFSDNDFFPIGILTPDGDTMRIVKKYTKNDLQNTPIDLCSRFELYDAGEVPEKPVKQVVESVAEPEEVIPEEKEIIPEPEQCVSEEPECQEPECKEPECKEPECKEPECKEPECKEPECEEPECEEPEQLEAVQQESEQETAVEAVPEVKTEEKAESKETNNSIWQTIDDPSSLFIDPELKETAAVIKEGMTANDGNSTLLAIPISSESPFPLMPVFRYGWSAMVEGKCCIVFRIKDGYLI